jgi:retron-type reverse transcriptase
MKRAGQLIESIVSADNMRLAFIKAVKGQRQKNNVVSYEKNLDNNLTLLSEKLRTATQTWGPYFCFKIFDPKERAIKVATIENRVAHHALMNICEPFFEQYQIFDSYACRKGKGQFAALERTKTFCRNNKWYLKLDVRKYFDSISHDVLKQQLFRRFKDIYVLNNFFGVIDSYESQPLCGVPIGSLTSQFFANHYLAVMDHFIKEQLKVTCYVRYMDDFVLWNDNAKTLQQNFAALENFLTNDLHLTLKPRCLNRCSQGMTFLGFRIFPDRMTLSHRSRYRFRRKLRTMTEHFECGEWNEKIYATHLETLFAFIRHAKTQNFRKRVMQEIGIEPQWFEPRESWRELEQQRQELPVGESEQQHADEQEQ